jgi:hypothetical protein
MSPNLRVGSCSKMITRRARRAAPWAAVTCSPGWPGGDGEFTGWFFGEGVDDGLHHFQAGCGALDLLGGQ